jgi:hypothetical protein
MNAKEAASLLNAVTVAAEATRNLQHVCEVLGAKLNAVYYEKQAERLEAQLLEIRAEHVLALPR